MKRQIHPFHLSSALLFYKTLNIDVTLHTTKIVKKRLERKTILHPVDHGIIFVRVKTEERSRKTEH